MKSFASWYMAPATGPVKAGSCMTTLSRFGYAKYDISAPSRLLFAALVGSDFLRASAREDGALRQQFLQPCPLALGA